MQAFGGARPGYIFTHGQHGVGYYQDTQAPPDPVKDSCPGGRPSATGNGLIPAPQPASDSSLGHTSGISSSTNGFAAEDPSSLGAQPSKAAGELASTACTALEGSSGYTNGIFGGTTFTDGRHPSSSSMHEVASTQGPMPDRGSATDGDSSGNGTPAGGASRPGFGALPAAPEGAPPGQPTASDRGERAEASTCTDTAALAVSSAAPMPEGTALGPRSGRLEHLDSCLDAGLGSKPGKVAGSQQGDAGAGLPGTERPRPKHYWGQVSCRRVAPPPPPPPLSLFLPLCLPPSLSLPLLSSLTSGCQHAAPARWHHQGT